MSKFNFVKPLEPLNKIEPPSPHPNLKTDFQALSSRLNAEKKAFSDSLTNNYDPGLTDPAAYSEHYWKFQKNKNELSPSHPDLKTDFKILTSKLDAEKKAFSDSLTNNYDPGLTDRATYSEHYWKFQKNKNDFREKKLETDFLINPLKDL